MEAAGKAEESDRAESVEIETQGEVVKADQEEKPSLTERFKNLMKTTYSMKAIMKTALIIFFALDIILVSYLKVLSVRRKRKKKLEKARRERQRIRQQIRAMYGEQL